MPQKFVQAHLASWLACAMTTKVAVRGRWSSANFSAIPKAAARAHAFAGAGCGHEILSNDLGYEQRMVTEIPILPLKRFSPPSTLGTILSEQLLLASEDFSPNQFLTNNQANYA